MMQVKRYKYLFETVEEAIYELSKKCVVTGKYKDYFAKLVQACEIRGWTMAEFEAEQVKRKCIMSPLQAKGNFLLARGKETV